MRHIGAQTYHDFAFGYTVAPINTQFQIGVDNAFDKQPPFFYQNVVTNANTDVQHYDTVGRYYLASRDREVLIQPVIATPCRAATSRAVFFLGGPKPERRMRGTP